MEATQKKTFLVLLAAGLLYFLLFIMPNSMGAADVNMLGLFEVDEFAFYPHVIRMLTPGDAAYQTLRNFLIYLQYFYGYPFFFFSALTLLPVKWLAGGGWEQLTCLNITLMRQMLSVLPLIASGLLLVHMQTRFKSLWRSLALFLLLLSLPGAVGNNMFWHPDGLSVLVIVLTFFFLERDDLSFGKNFYLAAVFCGVAVGVKNQGLFFFLAIPIYIIWGAALRRVSWRRAALLAVVFVVVMVLALVATNPLLLLPMERAEILSTQVRNLGALSQGFMVKTTDTYFQWGTYPADFRIHYGELYFVLLLLAALLLGIIRPGRRVIHVMILAFIVPLMISMNFSGTRRTHYFLPVMLPLLSCVVNLFPAENWGKGWRSPAKLLSLLLAGLVLLQFGIFVQRDVQMINDQLRREVDSQSIAFYHKLDERYFSQLPADEKLVIYRDWRVYVPASRDNWRVEMNWDLADAAYIDEMQPDVILLEMENVNLFTQEGIIAQASDEERMQAWHDFYAAALNDELPGYRVVLQDHFGLALVKE